MTPSMTPSMTHRPLSDDERDALWKRASQRLALVDIESPVSMNDVDAFLQAVGPRRPGQTLKAWLHPKSTTASSPPQPRAEIISLDHYRRRFKPVAEFVRLAADSGGVEVPLPAHPLETDDGSFRLKITEQNGELKVDIQALGLVSSDWADRTMALAGLGKDEPLLAVFELDHDGDASILLPDRNDVRRALLRPVLGQIDG